MNICIVGHICIDRNISENASYTSCGGPAIFMDKIFSQIPDLNLTIIAPYGNDFREYVKLLPLLPAKALTNKTLLYQNETLNGKRTQKAFNRLSAKSPILTDEIKQKLKNCDILFITPLLANFSPNYIKTITSFTKENTLKVLLPQGYFRSFRKDNIVIVRNFKEEDKILSLVDIVIVSEEDGKNMKKKAIEWSKKYDLISLVTEGGNGAVAFKSGKQTLLPTTNLSREKIIDSVGSVDIFAACFGYEYKKTLSIEKAGKFANKISRESLFYTPDKISEGISGFLKNYLSEDVNQVES